MCLQHILVTCTPSIILPHLSPILLKTISTGLILLFSYMNTKYMHHIHHLPFPYAHPIPLLLTPRKNLLYTPGMHFYLKCMLIVQGGFVLALQTYIYHALFKLAPSLLLFLYHYAPLIFNNLRCITLYCIHI
jgi:hypothetical protein